jgi:hypothetical protein
MSWLSDITGLSESDIALPSPSWTGTVDTATSGGITAASASGLLNSIGSSIGSVADFGFNVQKQQMAVQAQSQDNQLKSLLGNLGFQTAAIQAQSAAQVAQINAQKSVAQAQGTGGLSLSPTLLLLIAGAVYFMAKKG